MNDDNFKPALPSRYTPPEADIARAEQRGDNWITRLIHRSRPGQPTPDTTASGPPLADGSQLDLAALTNEELCQYRQDATIPERFGRRASLAQVAAWLEQKKQEAAETEANRIHPRY